MATSVTYNGITLFRPGAITRINADALNQVAGGANSIVGLVGEADGGPPGVANDPSSLVSTFDPSTAADIFRSGPLVDAIQFAFQSSNDPQVPGGASQVYIYKTNQSTQSTNTLPSDPAAVATLAPSQGGGNVAGLTTGGSTTTVIDSGLTATTVDDQFNGMYILLNEDTSDTETVQITDYDAGTGTFTFTPTIGAILASDTYTVYDPSEDFMLAVDTSGTTTTLINFKVSFAVPAVDALADHWVLLMNGTQTYTRRVLSNTATSLTLADPLPAVPSAGSWFHLLPNSVDVTSRDYGLHTNSVGIDVVAGVNGATQQTVSFEGNLKSSVFVGGTGQLRVLVKGAVTLTDATAAAPLSTTTVINLNTGGLTPSAEIGRQVLINGEYTTITANTATQLTVSPALTAAPDGVVTVEHPVADPIEFTDITDAHMIVSDGLTGGVASTLDFYTTGVAASDRTITFTAGMTTTQLRDSINSDPNYEAVIRNGVNGDTTLAADFDFGPHTRQTAQVSELIQDNAAGLHQDNLAVTNYYVNFSENVTAARSTGLPLDGNREPAVTLDEVFLSGGTRGSSTNTHFQDGLDTTLLRRMTQIIPLIDQDLENEGFGSTATVAAVAAQLAANVAEARGSAQTERGGFIGFRGTKTAVISQANAINDQDVQLTAQLPTALNNAGSLQEFGPRMLAVMAASMRAGVSSIGEPLTNKFLRVSSLSQDASWDPSNITDANDMINAGVMFAETKDGVGTRWVRDLTTFVQSNNLAFSEGSVRDVVRYIAYNLRTVLVERFIGRKNTPATIQSFKDVAATFLEQARSDEIIVDSTDLATGAVVHAWHNLQVFSSGDVVTLNVGCFPAVGINFILNNIFLQLPTQSA